MLRWSVLSKRHLPANGVRINRLSDRYGCGLGTEDIVDDCTSNGLELWLVVAMRSLDDLLFH